MTQIYGTRFRGTVSPYFVPKSAGRVEPDPRYPDDPCPCPGDPGYGFGGEFSGSNKRSLIEAITFFSNGGAVAGIYIGSSQILPYDVEIDSIVYQEHPGSGVSYFSYNLYVSDFEYAGTIVPSTPGHLPPLINHTLRIQEPGAVPVALQNPIGPIMSAGGTRDQYIVMGTKMGIRLPGSVNQRIHLAIKYTGTPGPNSYLSFFLGLREL